MAFKLQISFKDKEKQLYEYTLKAGGFSPSSYIKTLVLQDMQKNGDKKNSITVREG